MKNKAIYKFLYIAIYCIGFPVLAIVTLALSIVWNGYGMYGASSFAPFLFVLAAWLLTALIVGIARCIAKKRGKASKGKIKYANAIAPLVLIFGMFVIFEAALPPVLNDATSGTILYEDILEDADGMHEKLAAKVDEFKKKNNLGEDVKYSDSEFQDIFTAIFPSMDQAYKSFDPVAISVALEFPDLLTAILQGDMPLNLVATLILQTVQNDPVKYNHYLTIPQIIALNQDKIVQALNTLIANIDKINDGAVLGEVVDIVLLEKTYGGISWNIFQILGQNIVNPAEDPNAHIVKVDTKGNETVLGACLGYQDMAWLNGIPQMFFIPLYSAKNLIFGFTLAIAVLALLQQIVEKMYFAKFNEELSLIDDIKALKVKKRNKSVVAFAA